MQLSDRFFAVVLQADLLDELESRVVAPLVRETSGFPADRLHPKLRVGRYEYVMLPERLAGILKSEIGRVVASAKDRGWDLRRALDIVFTGV